MVTAIILILNSSILLYNRINLEKQAKLVLQGEFQNIKQHIHNVISIMILEDSFTSSIEASNYAESFRKLVLFHEGKIADSLLIYKSDGLLFADTQKPGLFNSSDNLSSLAINAQKKMGFNDIVVRRYNNLYYYSYHPISSLNGLIGTLFVGQNLELIFEELNQRFDYDLRNIEMIKASKKTYHWDHFEINSIANLELPAGFLIRYQIPAWDKSIANMIGLTIIMITLYFAFSSIWLRYRYSQEKLREEEMLRAGSARLVALGEMSAGIAHEINNPLTIITFKLNKLQRMLETETVDIDTHKEALRHIGLTVNRIAKIVKGLNSISRNAANDPMDKINLKNVTEDALELCRERFKNCSVDLRLEFEDAENYYINGRATQLTQVLLNLLGNALDAVTPLDEKWVQLKITQNENQILIIVTDSGNGIPEDIFEKIMQPFFTTKEVGKGTGLGLSISKNIILEHNGELFCDKNAQNTSFVIKLNAFNGPPAV